MSEATIMLQAEPTTSDFARVTEAAQLGCECTERMAATYREKAAAGESTAGLRLCKSCAARFALNCVTTLAGQL